MQKTLLIGYLGKDPELLAELEVPFPVDQVLWRVRKTGVNREETAAQSQSGWRLVHHPHVLANG